jgi:DNA transformation protein
MGELAKLVNIGPTLENQLGQVGITSPEKLKAAGSREAWLRIKAIDPSACIMRLSALEGAIRGIRWHNLEPEVKAELSRFYHANK